MRTRLSSLLTLVVSIAATGLLRADPMDPPIDMGFDETRFRPEGVGSISGTPVLGGSLSTPFSFTTADGLFEGSLGVTILSDATENTLGGLTFVYEIKNTSTLPGYYGVSLFQVAGWSDLLVAMDLGNSYFFEQTANPTGVYPFDFVRQTDSVGAGGTIQVTYPEDSNGPPVYPGEQSFQMIIHTNATTWNEVKADIRLEAFNGDGILGSVSVLTYSPAVGMSAPGVPDGGMTLVLLGATFLGLAVFAPRWQAKARN